MITHFILHSFLLTISLLLKCCCLGFVVTSILFFVLFLVSRLFVVAFYQWSLEHHLLHTCNTLFSLFFFRLYHRFFIPSHTYFDSRLLNRKRHITFNHFCFSSAINTKIIARMAVKCGNPTYSITNTVQRLFYSNIIASLAVIYPLAK